MADASRAQCSKASATMFHVKQRSAKISGSGQRTVARTTRDGSSRSPSPTTSSRAFVTRYLRSCFSAASISVAPLAPLRRINSPPLRTSGAVSGTSVRSALTARAVTASSTGPNFQSSARARTTSTLSSPSSVDCSVSQATRRSIGSMSTHCTSGRAIARTIPGSPAPEPTSPTRPGENSGAMTALLRMCRLHRRGGSRGPIRPRSSPYSPSASVNRRARSIRSPKRTAAAEGSCSISVIDVSRETQRQPRLITVWRSAPSPYDSDTKPRSDTMSCTSLRS